jgi:trans-aconitate methyltransferase
MTDTSTPYRFYGDLARWWPVISPVADYQAEASYVASLLRAHPQPVQLVLELGSGGGHNAWHLKAHFGLTLTDLSGEILAESRRLNPECEHVQADMRDLRLARQFDAVFVHDAVDYMTTEADLTLALLTAHEHCRPGGLAIFMPDDIRETFEESTELDEHDAEDGRAVRLMTWTWDPDQSDDAVRTEYSFLLRDADGQVQAVHETHHIGVFGRQVWLRLLAQVGFNARAVLEDTSEDRTPRTVFLGVRREEQGE